ncbi:MAG: diaminopimelate decarboxylase, partial [Flavobacteriales bacterium]|nr:diaminopimelate decarboxylase [Flavobacteriales bacterium]
MLQFNGQEYHIGGVPVSDLVQQFDTPVYVYDTTSVRAQYERLKSAFPGGKVKIKYACKALNN